MKRGEKGKLEGKNGEGEREGGEKEKGRKGEKEEGREGGREGGGVRWPPVRLGIQLKVWALPALSWLKRELSWKEPLLWWAFHKHLGSQH